MKYHERMRIKSSNVNSSTSRPSVTTCYAQLSDSNKNLGPKAKAKDLNPKDKDLRSHKANVQRQYIKVKGDNDHELVLCINS